MILFAALLWTQVRAPRLFTPLDNGAMIYAQSAPNDTSINISLFASLRKVGSKRPGIAHLLEHLVARGKDGKLDARLESAGCFLKAETTRDFVEIDISCDPASVQLGFDALKEILAPKIWDQAAIEQEIKVIGQEAALEDDSARLAAAEWTTAFGERGSNPIGDPKALVGATPGELEAARAETFSADCLVLTVEGPMETNEATSAARPLLESFKPFESPERPLRKLLKSVGRSETEAFGEARAAISPGLQHPEGLATLAAALAIASNVPESFVTYTPSPDQAVVTVGNCTRLNLLGQSVDAMDPGSYFVRGRALAYYWMLKQAANPKSEARFQGMMLVQGSRLKPEAAIEAIIGMTQAQFRSAFAKFGHDTALVAIGSRG